MNLLVISSTILILIGLNALYVAAEFSAVSSRRARLAQLAKEGNPAAAQILAIVENVRNLDTYIAACQVGITLTSLLLGYYGQATLAEMLAPVFQRLGGLSQVAAHSTAVTIVLAFLTGLQVLLGELTPKNVGIQYPEKLALLTVRPVRWSMALFRPLIWLFNGSGRLLLKLLGLEEGMEHAHIHAPEEILILVEESGAAGLLQDEEKRLLENTLRLRKLLVRHVMVPRTQMLAASIDEPFQRILEILANSPYSRLPLYQGSIDNVVGIVHLKDLLCLEGGPGPKDVRQVLREVAIVFENTPVEEAFLQLQKGRVHMAIVLDEYGGTAGLVTLQDLIEEIFGELSDEFDVVVPPIQVTGDECILVRGDVLVTDLNEWLDLYLPTDEADTIGGLVLSELNRIPRKGDTVTVAGVTIRVEKVEGKRIALVSMALPREKVQRAKGKLL